MNTFLRSLDIRRVAAVTGGGAFFPLFVLFGLNLVAQLDTAAFNVLLPNIQQAFGLNFAGALGLIALITPVTLVVGVPIAYAADRVNRVRLAAIGAAIWAIFSFGTGLVVNVMMMVLVRMGSGLAQATNAPTHNSLLADYYPAEVRPGVYSFHQSAQTVGLLVSPLAAGVLGYVFDWRVPFLLFSIPTMIFVFLCFGLREPPRGIQDRLALGATQAEAETAETPPSFTESMRLLFRVQAIRRTMIALPFLGASFLGLGSVQSLFMANVFHLNTAVRGVLAAVGQPFALIGLAVGAGLGQRLLARNPSLVLRFLGLTGIGVGATIVGMAISPDVGVFVVMLFLQGFIGAILSPGIFAVASLVIPAKARSLGFIITTLALLPGVFILPVVGDIGDRYGLRVAIMIMAPLYVMGSLLLASAGRFLPADIKTVRVQSMAEQEVRKALGSGEPKLLMVRGLDVAYDQVQVLFGVDLEIRPGEMVALLGTNGAGKSTVLKAISGLVDPISGAIYFDNRDITHVDPLATFKLGIVYMPGGRSVFPSLTVAEHLDLARAGLPEGHVIDVEAAQIEILDTFPRLRERWNQLAGNLSGGEQQMLGLAIALIARPRLLMIDELSLGLAPAIVTLLLDVVRRIHAQGTTVILVEQSVNVALSVADRAYFLEKGEVRFSGPTAELLERGDILRAVFLQGSGRSAGPTKATTGTRPAMPTPDLPSRTDEGSQLTPLLEVRGISRSFGGLRAVNHVSFVLRRHEILGLIGPNGAGKTTIFDLVSGFVEPDEGAVVLDGVDVTSWSPDRRARAGLGRSFQDARIFRSLTVAENLAVSLERHLEVRDHVADALRLPAVEAQEGNVRFTVAQLIEMMNLGAFRDKFVSELSTGSRRVVDLAMAIAFDPKVLILDEPSSGIAQRETEALGPLLQRIHREVGCSILVIEHDMGLITGISDRMLALEVGAIIVEGTPNEVISNPRVISSYLGGDLTSVHRSGAVNGPSANGRRRTPKAAAR